MSTLQKLIEKLDRDQALEQVSTRLDADEDAVAILDDCREGMTNVGDLLCAFY